MVEWDWECVLYERKNCKSVREREDVKIWNFRFSQQFYLWFESSGIWRFVLFERIATDTSKYHRVVSSGSSTPSRPLHPADEDTAILRTGGNHPPSSKALFPKSYDSEVQYVETNCFKHKRKWENNVTRMCHLLQAAGNRMRN